MLAAIIISLSALVTPVVQTDQIVIAVSDNGTLLIALNVGGEWERLNTGTSSSVASECRELATLVCGAGKICSMRVHDGPDGQDCIFVCRDEEGKCPGAATP